MAIVIVANSLVLFLWALSPVRTVPGACRNIDQGGGRSEQICFDHEEPLILRRYLFAGAILANGLLLAAWVLVPNKEQAARR